MQVSGYGSAYAAVQSSTTRRGWGTSAPSVGTPSGVGGTADAFLAEAKKTPAERIRDDWLARHKMTEKDLQSMPPEKREAVEKEIAEELKRKLTGQDAKRGAVMNLSA
ncbi:hypothetical protein AZL_017140 [Azospirillum sp. B510]|uniref:hypothetical protein n=1 Tax=Azospirillum sp. (strain B510) TaxID=137722 RepID=UPI0001C4BFEE|nr:hypothetical protein [Azospirillum sp. B510]BAI72352.1 hypothetical protein AZL_017140 [Azospirillum sp. B510]